MSYIRCTSNPEGLYIWGDGENINITGAKIQKIILIPQKTFDGLLKKFVKGYWEDCEYQGASIKELYVVDKKKKPTVFEKLLKLKPGKFQMRLSYKKWHTDMYLVTWIYICQRYIRK